MLCIVVVYCGGVVARSCTLSQVIRPRCFICHDQVGDNVMSRILQTVVGYSITLLGMIFGRMQYIGKPQSIILWHCHLTCTSHGAATSPVHPMVLPRHLYSFDSKDHAAGMCTVWSASVPLNAQQTFWKGCQDCSAFCGAGVAPSPARFLACINSAWIQYTTVREPMAMALSLYACGDDTVTLCMW